MSSITVEMGSKRKAFKIPTPSTNIQFIMKDIATFFEIRDPESVALKHRHNIVDTSVPFRLSGLSNNVVLELVKKSDTSSLKKKLPDSRTKPSKLAISVDGGGKLVATFPSSATLADVIQRCVEEGKLSGNQCPAENAGETIVTPRVEVNILGQIYSPAVLQSTTLHEVGLAGQSARIHVRSLSSSNDAPAVPSTTTQTDSIDKTSVQQHGTSAETTDPLKESKQLALEEALPSAVDSEQNMSSTKMGVSNPPVIPHDNNVSIRSVEYYCSLQTQKRYKAALERVCSSGFSATVQPALVLLLKYLTNVINHYPPHPLFGKYSTINCSNKMFWTVQGVSGAVEVLLALGFMPSLRHRQGSQRLLGEVISRDGEDDNWSQILSPREFCHVMPPSTVVLPSVPPELSTGGDQNIESLDSVCLSMHASRIPDMLELVMMRERLAHVAQTEFGVSETDYPELSPQAAARKVNSNTNATPGPSQPAEGDQLGTLRALTQMAKQTFESDSDRGPAQLSEDINPAIPAFDPYQSYSTRTSNPNERKPLARPGGEHSGNHNTGSVNDILQVHPNALTIDGKVRQLEALKCELLAHADVSRDTQLILPRFQAEFSAESTADPDPSDDVEYRQHDKKLVMSHLMKKIKLTPAGSAGTDGSEEGSTDPLRPKVFRTYDSLRDSRIYTRTLVRVKLPDSSLLLGYFHPQDPLHRVYQWLVECTKEEVVHELLGAKNNEGCYSLPDCQRLFTVRFPHLAYLSKSVDGKRSSIVEKTLLEAECVPSTTAHCAWSSELAQLLGQPDGTMSTVMEVEGGGSSTGTSSEITTMLPSVQASRVFDTKYMVASSSQAINSLPAGIALGTHLDEKFGSDTAARGTSKEDHVLSSEVNPGLVPSSADPSVSQPGISSASSAAAPGKAGKPNTGTNKPKWFKLH